MAEEFEKPQYSEQEQIRRAKLAKYCEEGRDPYTITRFDRTHTSVEVLSNFDALEGKTVRIAGRMMSRRIMGKASFVHMMDGEGQIQAYVRREDVGEDVYADFKTMDIGDILGVEGVVFRTKTGEVSVHATSLTLLSKSLRVLPEKWNGLRDQDMRYRQRYVDTIVNPEVKDTFIKRSQILKALREFLDAKGFLEVDTPVLQTIEIGANSRSFVTHHNALDIPMYLRIETELYLKRLIVGGFDKVYEVGRIFRNEGMDTRHNPEFTSIELYQAYADYKEIMDLVEEMYIYVTKKVCGTLKIQYQGKTVSVSTSDLTFSENVPENKKLATIYAPRTGKASLRQTASSKGTLLKNCKAGTIVSVLAIGNGYTRINYKGTVGYIKTACLKFYGDSESTAQGVLSYKGNTGGGTTVNVRNTPKGDSAKVAEWRTGTEVTILSHANGWYEIEANGMHGYVMEKYVTEK